MEPEEIKLTNEQRRYLALRPVEDNWDEVRLNKQITLYFEGDIIRKKITRTENSYVEVELDRITSEGRTMLPPLTIRGKARKLNYTGISGCSPVGSYFQWYGGEYGKVRIGSYISQHTYYTSSGSGEKLSGWPDVMNWLGRWMAESTSNDLQDLEAFRRAGRNHQKIKDGDVFTFKVGRWEYGFGQVLMDLRKLKKDIKVGKTDLAHQGIANLPGPALIVSVYKLLSSAPDTDLSKLSSTPQFLSQFIMDNRLYYGEYKIIGNLPVKLEELAPPISFTRSISALSPELMYLQYGMIYCETTVKEFSSWYEGKQKKGCHWQMARPDSFRCESNGFSLNVLFDIPALRNAILKDGNGDVYLGVEENDLRHPGQSEAKHDIFAYFGLDGTKSYGENLKLFCARPPSL